LFVLAAAPLIASELTELWTAYASRFGKRSAIAALEEVAADTAGSFRRITPWALVLAAAAASLTPAESWPADFSAKHFPREMVFRHKSYLAGSRLLTSDQWGDYLIYHLYPNIRVYMDGRSDFFGEDIGKQYLAMLQLDGKWQQHLQQNQFDSVLAPVSWPLVSALRMSPEWQEMDADSSAVLFIRRRQ
jgi:hypothetical protein